MADGGRPEDVLSGAEELPGMSCDRAHQPLRVLLGRLRILKEAHDEFVFSFSGFLLQHSGTSKDQAMFARVRSCKVAMKWVSFTPFDVILY